MTDSLFEAETLAVPLGLAMPLSTQHRNIVADAIEDAQADVEAELNRPIIPTSQTVPGCFPVIGYDLFDARAWPHLLDLFDDEFTVTAADLSPDGTYSVECKVGIDGAATPAIARFVKAHALQAIRNGGLIPEVKRVIKNVSAEGQSVSYDTGSVAEGAAGALPSMKSLRAHKRRSAYRRPNAPAARWPYN